MQAAAMKANTCVFWQQCEASILLLSSAIHARAAMVIEYELEQLELGG